MNKKRPLIVLLTLIMVLSMAFFFACTNDGPNGTVEEPTPTVSGWTYELMTDVVIPMEDVFSGVSADDMLDGTVTYRFKSPEYINEEGKAVRDVIESAFPNVYLNRVGEWTVVYIRGNEAVAKTFNVVDTIAPTIEFKSNAYDVFVEIENLDEEDEVDYQPKYKKYNLPSVSAKDLSGIKMDSRIDKIELSVNKSDPAYDENNPIIDLPVDTMGRYTPKATGKIKYTISVEDIYGNKSEKSLYWNVKGHNWTDNELAEGYLADYDDAGYINSVEQGWVASYWADSEIYEEWFAEFEGATGVLKVSAAPNQHAQGCFQYNLPGSITQEQLSGKQLLIKVYTTNAIEYVYFGCKTYDQVSDMKHAFKIEIVPNQWNYIAINSAELIYGTFDRGDDIIDQFSICFGTYMNGYKMTEDCVLYIDSVTLAEDLSSVENIVIEGNTLNWSDVENATAYEVMEGNNITVVKASNYTVTDKMAKIGVRALSTNPLYISQNIYTPFIDVKTFGENDLALFNTPSYELLAIKNNTASARMAASVTAEYLESYNGVENVLKVTSVNNNVFGTTGIGDITLMIPKACAGSFTIKFMAAKCDGTQVRFLQPTSEFGWDNLNDISVSQTWETWHVKYNEGCWVEGGVPYNRIDIMIQGGAAGAENVFYFAIVQNGDTVMDIKMADITTTLKERELATYDSDRWLITTSTDSCPYHASDCDHVIDYSFAESYTDSNDVTHNGLLKIDVTNCSYMCNAGWMLKLLKEHSGTYTIRYLVHVENGDTATATIVTRNVNYDGSVINNEYGIDVTTDVWNTVVVTTESVNRKVVSMYNYGPEAKFTIYIDGVWDGNIVAEEDPAGPDIFA